MFKCILFVRGVDDLLLGATSLNTYEYVVYRLQWNPFLGVEEVVVPPGELPHPQVQVVQHPRDGGHHLAFTAASQPSSPFILAPPPVYQLQQYQQSAQAVVMGGEARSSENTGKLGGVVVGDAMPQPINPFQVCRRVPNPPLGW